MKSINLFLFASIMLFFVSCKDDNKVDDKTAAANSILKKGDTWSYFENDVEIGTVSFRDGNKTFFDGMETSVKWEATVNDNLSIDNLKLYTDNGPVAVDDVTKLNEWVMGNGEINCTVESQSGKLVITASNMLNQRGFEFRQ